MQKGLTLLVIFHSLSVKQLISSSEKQTQQKEKEFSGFLLAFTGEGEGEEGVDRILLQSRAIRSPLLARSLRRSLIRSESPIWWRPTPATRSATPSWWGIKRLPQFGFLICFCFPLDLGLMIFSPKIPPCWSRLDWWTDSPLLWS